MTKCLQRAWKVLNYKLVQRAGRALAGLLGLARAGKLELHVPVALLDCRLQQPAKRMEEDRIKRQRHALPLRGVQRDHGLAVAVVAGLDAREQQRRLAERRGMAAGVVGL